MFKRAMFTVEAVDKINTVEVNGRGCGKRGIRNDDRLRLRA